MKKLPPLTAVRAFEACYRLGSYTRAAQSLNVQQPAISHQIRMLEDDLGAKLFVKRGAFIESTKVADQYFVSISWALGEILAASERIRQKQSGVTLTLATYPGIAAFWAFPRVEKLRATHPEIDIVVTTSELDAQIPMGEADCTILFGAGNWPGMKSIKLIDEDVVVIASPKMAIEFAGLPAEEFLLKAPLINLEDPENRWVSWERWAKLNAPNFNFKRPRISVTNHGVALNQALMGYGVALGWRGIIDSLLEQESLVALDYPSLKTESGYYFVYPESFGASDLFGPLLKSLTS